MLTQREMQIAKYISQGLIEKEIADRLFLSPFTIHTHTRRIREKTKARNMADITRLYITRLRFIPLLKSLHLDQEISITWIQ